MELKLLVDNHALYHGSFKAEPGFSMYIQEGETKILLDAGFSDIFLENARKLGVDLLHLDWVVLSHGHWDHTWGLQHLIQYHFEAAEAGLSVPKPRLAAHPLALSTKYEPERNEIGSLFSAGKMSRHFDMQLSAEPLWLTEKLCMLGEVERRFDFEASSAIGRRLDTEGSVKDYLPDDTSLAYVSDQGLVVITGCAHAGVCNTVEHARQVTGVDRVHTVIGGFHMLDVSVARLSSTADYLGALSLDALYPCHCTDLAAKIGLASKCPVREGGAGLHLSL